MAHARGSINCVADSLFRRHAPEPLTISIQAKEVTVPPRQARLANFYRRPAPNMRPDLWGMNPTCAAAAEKSAVIHVVVHSRSFSAMSHSAHCL
eukprot:1908759-Amphidinium_carterae.2